MSKPARFHCAAIVAALASALAATQALSCTNLIVTKGASADGSVMITYTCDGEFHPHLEYKPAADHEPGAIAQLWGGVEIPQIAHTYAVFGLMNEHQLAIAETTFDGHAELVNPEGTLGYWHLMDLALQRARTAREAIEVMTSLVEEHGYASSGETFSIADTEEAWLLEMIGPGPGGKGAHWVALRVPDGMVSAHANKARIGTFPLDDPDNCLYSESVIDFAIEKGYYDPDSGEPFSFCAAYCPATPKSQRWADGRVWSLFRRAAPSLGLSADYFRAVPGAEPYPLWIEPDEPIALGDVFALMRDHFGGTDFDMSQGLDAGPYNTPKRWRPLHWTVDDVEYAWERPISTQQTGFSFVSQSRGFLPDPIGGVYWYGLDDTSFTCYMPFYCGVDLVPTSLAFGELGAFTWDSAWWVFNFVANYANLRYVHMKEDILAVQREIEGTLLALQPAVEATALRLHEEDPQLMQRYLTDYCVSHANLTVERWRSLGELLIRKYNDGYIQRSPGHAEGLGYPDEWLRRVIESRGDDFRVPVEEAEPDPMECNE